MDRHHVGRCRTNGRKDDERLKLSGRQPNARAGRWRTGDEGESQRSARLMEAACSALTGGAGGGGAEIAPELSLPPGVCGVHPRPRLLAARVRCCAAPCSVRGRRPAPAAGEPRLWLAHPPRCARWMSAVARRKVGRWQVFQMHTAQREALGCVC